jgi:hypothetical protein
MPTPNAKTAKKPVSIADIRRRVEKILPWRHGKTGRGNLGLFKVKPEVMRSKYRNDLPVIMHELGHFLDKKLGLRGVENPVIERELADAAEVASGPGYTDEQIRGEGVAQFFLHYAANDRQARGKFPEYYLEFEKELAKNPELQKEVAEIKGLVTSYFKQNPHARLLSHIARGTDKVSAPLLEKAKEYGDKVYNLGVDSLAPLRRVTEEVRKKLGVKHLDDDMNLYARARTAAGFKGRADQDTEPFLNVLRGLKPEDHDLLSACLTAGRALDYRMNDLHPGLSTSTREELDILKAAPQHVKDAASKLHEIYSDMVFKTLVDTGIMTREQFDYLQAKWPHYVPFFRVGNASEFERDFRVFLRGKGASLVNLGNPIKKAKGVENEAEVYDIRDPLESMLRNIQAFHAQAARNGVGKAMLRIAGVEGMGRFAERVGSSGEKGDNVFYVWRGGRKEYYATDPDVYAALTAMDEGSPTNSGLAKLARILTVPVDAFRAGTTRYNPAFVVTNFIRDSLGASINSESWMPPIFNTIKGLIIQNSSDPKMKALFNEAKEEGVLYSGVTEIKGNSPMVLGKEIERAFKEGGMTGAVKRKIKTLAEWIGSKNEAIEIAPKLYEYYYLRSRGVPKQEAAMRAREVNIDFQRAGSAGRQYNKSTAFFNAGVQGVDKTLQTLRARPYETMAKVGLYVGIPSLVAWALGQGGDEEDREEYEGIGKQMKDLYWHFKMGDTWVRIPKPEQYGLFGSLVERALDAAYKKDPAAFRGFGDSIADAALPPLVPTLLLPWGEVWANKSSFTGRPIVSRKYEGLPNELQYGPETSGIAKRIGEMTGISPLNVDHVIRGMGGTVGREAAKLPDRLLGSRNREEERWNEKPFIRSFFTNPNRSNEIVDQFYELSDRMMKAKNGYEARGSVGEPGKDVELAGAFAKARRNLAKINRVRAEIQQDPNMSPREKRKEMDELDKDAVNLAREMMREYNEYE